MCYEKFLRYFNENILVSETDETVYNFINTFSKKEFGNGIFIVFDKENIGKWNDVILEMFPNVEVFSVKWN